MREKDYAIHVCERSFQPKGTASTKALEERCLSRLSASKEVSLIRGEERKQKLRTGDGGVWRGGNWSCGKFSSKEVSQ